MASTLRLALRSLLRSRPSTFMVMAILEVGTGLNAAIFDVVDCVLLRPFGYHVVDEVRSDSPAASARRVSTINR